MNITYTCTVETPLGKMKASAVRDALTGLWFIGQKYYPSGTFRWTEDPEHPVFEELRRRLDFYFCGHEGQGITDQKINLRLDPEGTDFQRAVWEILLQVPYGKVITYGEIAQSMARSRGLSAMSARAVGGAVGHNPISILIPCHRVVGSKEKQIGYAGGLDKKEALLRLEGSTFALKQSVVL